MQDCKVDILGTEYSIFFVDELPELLKPIGEDIDGLFGQYDREIYILKTAEDFLTENGEERRMKQTLRHELIHGFLVESGISANANMNFGAWSENEEMIDWLAIQSPKIFKMFSELDLL